MTGRPSVFRGGRRKNHSLNVSRANIGSSRSGAIPTSHFSAPLVHVDCENQFAKPGITLAEAKAFIQHYFERFAGVRAWLDRTVEEARHKGFVETLFGQTNAFGALRFTSASRIVVNARIYSKLLGAADSDSAGQSFDGVPSVTASTRVNKTDSGEMSELLAMGSIIRYDRAEEQEIQCLAPQALARSNDGPGSLPIESHRGD